MQFPSGSPADLIHSWLASRMTSESIRWLDERLLSASDPKSFFASFGLIPRKVGKEDLKPTPVETMTARLARPGWDPTFWSVDQAARSLLVLALPDDDEANFTALLDKLFAAAAVDELVALYQSMALWPFPSAHAWRAGEGIRTNMKAVFVSIAHRNPYPAENLDEGAWNQMVLKCLFVGVPLYPVRGIDDRCNPALMKMLVDYAYERRVANRPVSPELWRCVGRHADERAIAALAKTLGIDDDLERRAARLALQACPQHNAKAALDEVGMSESNTDTWERIGRGQPI
jgi:hypothetical protein